MYGGGVARLVAERCSAKCSVTRDIGLERCRIREFAQEDLGDS